MVTLPGSSGFTKTIHWVSHSKEPQTESKYSSKLHTTISYLSFSFHKSWETCCTPTSNKGYSAPDRIFLFCLRCISPLPISSLASGLVWHQPLTWLTWDSTWAFAASQLFLVFGWIIPFTPFSDGCHWWLQIQVGKAYIWCTYMQGSVLGPVLSSTFFYGWRIYLYSLLNTMRLVTSRRMII